MIKKVIMIIGCSLLLSGCTFGTKKSAIEVYSTPNAKVYVNGKEMGTTPYKNTAMVPQAVEIKLISGSKSVNKKIVLKNGLTTVIDWKFDNNGDDGGYILNMENTGGSKCGLIINSIPNKATIAIENEIIGSTPKKIDDLGVGEKHVSVNFPGYQGANLFLKTTMGYNLIVEAKLIKDNKVIQAEIEPELSPVSESVFVIMVKIKETETGWLKVRELNSGTSKELTKVKPDERYELIEEKADWVKIKLNDGSQGWVSSKYVEKVSN